MGGMGASGLGRRHGAEGLLRYTEAQTLARNGSRCWTRRSWVPYGLYTRIMAASLRLLKRRLRRPLTGNKQSGRNAQFDLLWAGPSQVNISYQAKAGP